MSSIGVIFGGSRRLFLRVLVGSFLISALFFVRTHVANAASCTAPSTDYGTVTGLSANIASTGTYRIWTRMAAPDTTNNTYMLEIDGSSCYTIGGSSVPTYAAGATTYFNNDSSNWISKTSGGAEMDITLSAGTHTFSLIGNAPNVVVDRLVMTQDTTCVPTGTGDNCANPPDTTPPVANITSPSNNANVSGTISVGVNATDNSGTVSKVELYVDGASTPTQTSTNSPFSFSLNTATLSIGAHTLEVKAYDPSNNVGTSGTVTINVVATSPPTVSISAPPTNSSESGVITVTALATDNVGVTKVEFFTDSSTTPFSTISTNGPYTTSLDTKTLSNGSHTITAKAFDAAGNVQTSSAVAITVSNSGSSSDTTPPTVSIISPVSNTVLNADYDRTAHTTESYTSTAYTVSAAAADASGIANVQLFVDGSTTPAATVTTAPYNLTTNISSMHCGVHTFKVTATDASANHHAARATVSFSVTLAENISNSGSCRVGLADYSLLKGLYGKSGSAITNPRADINGDGTVNLADYSLLKGKYGQQLN